jgi:GNAT superfamily N-acetyltransferase
VAHERVTYALCPPALVSEALAIVLRELTSNDREAISKGVESNLETTTRTLFAAIEESRLLDAAWGQLQPGNCAVLWPPASSSIVGQELISRVTESLDQFEVRMAQIMTKDRSSPVVPIVESAGFEHLAEIVYLSRDLESAKSGPQHALTWQAFDESQFNRLAALTEATYVNTQDCPAMNCRRPIAEVMDGYRGTGKFRPENWQIAQIDGKDVGVLLLGDYGLEGYCELMYMGLTPEARGRGFGREIVLRAMELTRRCNSLRLLVAVDANNKPALNVYRDSGFVAWERRAAYVRFRDE